jgi:hypothetical protein
MIGFSNSDDAREEMAIEIGKARRVDPTLHVEAVMLGVIKKNAVIWTKRRWAGEGSPST